jgi:predicted nucleotidyltransferase
MPLRPETQEILIESAKKYGVKSLWLFGSSLAVDEKDAGDIDLGREELKIYHACLNDLTVAPRCSS